MITSSATAEDPSFETRIVYKVFSIKQIFSERLSELIVYSFINGEKRFIKF